MQITSLSPILNPSQEAASKTLSVTIFAKSSPSLMIGQRIPLETVPTFLSILNILSA